MEIKRFIGGSLEANCYVITTSVSSGKNCFIIDPGYNPKNIIKYIKEKNLNPKGIILTHHHHDHGGGAPLIRKELDCPVMIHTLDADLYGGQVDVYLEDGDIIVFESDQTTACQFGRATSNQLERTFTSSAEQLEVLHTPGHTEGGICLMNRGDKICFTGDTIFNVDLGRTDLEDGSETAMRKSIKNVVDKWGNDIKIYPGHGDPATMKTVRRINKEFKDIISGDIK